MNNFADAHMVGAVREPPLRNTNEESQGLPEGWEWKALDKACDVILGQSPESSTYNRDGIGLPFFQGKAEFGALYPTVVKWCSSPKKIAQKNDVLISVRAPVGPTNLAPSECCIGRGLAAIRPLKDNLYLYILYYLRSIEPKLSQMGTGSTFAAITGSELKSIKIPLAPLPQQKLIVAEIEKQFSRLDEAVAALRRVQANLKRYKASVLKAAVEGRLTEEWREQNICRGGSRTALTRTAPTECESGADLLKRILAERRKKWEDDYVKKYVGAHGHAPKDDSWKKKYKEPAALDTSNLPKLPEGWVWGKSDQLFYFVTSGSRGWADYYSETGAIFLRMGNLDHDTVKLDLFDIQRVQPPVGTEGTRTHVMPGDILVSITADVGMVAVIPDGFEEAYINQHVALARPVPIINSLYLAWYLAGKNGQDQFKELQRGATKVGLGLDDIRSVDVPLPSMAEQKAIIEELDRRLSVAEEVEAIIETNLKRAERMRQAILKKAFEGRLV